MTPKAPYQGPYFNPLTLCLSLSLSLSLFVFLLQVCHTNVAGGLQLSLGTEPRLSTAVTASVSKST